MFWSKIHFSFFMLTKHNQLGTFCNLSNSNPNRTVSFIFMVVLWRFFIQLIKTKWISLKICYRIKVQKNKLQNQAYLKINAFKCILSLFKKSLGTTEWINCPIDSPSFIYLNTISEQHKENESSWETSQQVQLKWWQWNFQLWKCMLS